MLNWYLQSDFFIFFLVPDSCLQVAAEASLLMFVPLDEMQAESVVRQLRHALGSFLTDCSALPPHTRRVTFSALCPCLLCADWRLRFGVVANPRLQGMPGPPEFCRKTPSLSLFNQSHMHSFPSSCVHPTVTPTTLGRRARAQGGGGC